MKEFGVIELKDILKADIIGPINHSVKEICFDSRNVNKYSLFVCLIGERNNGHNFLDDVYEKGVRVALISDKSVLTLDDTRKDMTYIYVEDTMKAMQDLAAYYRDNFIKFPVIAVTGSVGKTSTREMLCAALSYDKKIFKTPANNNSQIGVPVTVTKIEEEYDYAVLEAGVSMPGEMDNLSRIIKPDVLIFTNIFDTHIESFGSRLAIINEKSKLQKNMPAGSYVIINSDSKELDEYKFRDDLKVIRVSKAYKQNSYAYAEGISSDNGIYSFTAVIDKEKYKVELACMGEQQVMNALIALATCKVLSLDINNCIKGIKNFKGFKHRSEVTKTEKFVLIDDSYNATQASMICGLNLLNEYKVDSGSLKVRKIAVIGDMKELADLAKSVHIEVAKHICGLDTIDIVVYIGEFSEEISEIINNNSNKKFIYAKNEEKLHKEVFGLIDENCFNILLLKGSHSMNLHLLADKIKEERC